MTESRADFVIYYKWRNGNPKSEKEIFGPPKKWRHDHERGVLL